MGHDPAGVQLVIKELSSGLQNLELHDESGAFLEVEKPEKQGVITPASSCPSMASSRESVVDELTNMVITADTGFQDPLESVKIEFQTIF